MKKKVLQSKGNEWLVSIRNVTLVCVSGGKKCLFSGKFGVFFFTCYLQFKICTFDLLPTYCRRILNIFSPLIYSFYCRLWTFNYLLNHLDKQKFILRPKNIIYTQTKLWKGLLFFPIYNLFSFSLSLLFIEH